MTRNPRWLTIAAMLLMAVMAVMAVMAASTPATLQAYPEPAVVSPSWEVTFTSAKPRPISVRDAAGDLQWYWYVTYKVVNRTGEDRLFVPEVQVATNAGDLILAGRGVPSAVFFAVKAKEGNDLLESPNQVVGRLLQGEEHARESAIIWPAFKHDVDEVNLFVAGLSGETTSAPHPQTNEPVVFRKTLMLTYQFPGDSLTTPPQDQAVVVDGHAWIMR